MKLHPSDLYLSHILATLNDVIVPELHTETAATSAAILQACVRELLRREQQSPAIVERANRAGLEIIRHMREALAGHGVTAKTPDISAQQIVAAGERPLQALIDQNTRITENMTALLRELSAIPAAAREPCVNTLLRQAADWEYGFHLEQLNAGPGDTVQAEQDPLPRAALEAFLRSVHPDGDAVQLLAMTRAEGGSGKQTYFITIAGRDGAARELVVRKADRTLMMTTGAYLIEREFHLLSAVAATGFLAPKPLWFGSDVAGTDGGNFFIMERMPGKIPGTYLGGAAHIEEDLLLELAEHLARLHNIPLDHFRSYIERYEPPTLLEETIEACTRRTVEEWRAYATTAHQHPSPAHEYMIDWLSRNVPANSGTPVLVHGDFNTHNILIHEGRVGAVLDWEGALFGAPELDLAYIRPHISRHIAWDKFVGRYLEVGGKAIDRDAMDFYQTLLAMRVMNGIASTTRNLQEGATNDLRLFMVQLGYITEFTRIGLEGCKE